MNPDRPLLLVFIITVVSCPIFAQQLYIEGFTARQRTNYDLTAYQSKKIWYSPLGIRLAAGADNLQVGGEFRFNLKDPQWDITDQTTNELLGTHTFSSSYYGALIRYKISRYPARRFGLHIIAGAGWTDMERQSTIPGESAALSYDPTLTYNGSLGVSIPTGKAIMVELGYSYFHVEFKEQETLPNMKGSFHSFHLGFSYNMVFGKRAAAYGKILKD